MNALEAWVRQIATQVADERIKRDIAFREATARLHEYRHARDDAETEVIRLRKKLEDAGISDA